MTQAMVSVSSSGDVALETSAARFERATLTLRDSDEEPLSCQFNPTEYTISKSSAWTRVPVRAAVSAAIPEFVGTNAAQLSLELFFDAREHNQTGVSESVNRLLSWTQPSARSIDRNAPSPPVVAFEWGRSDVFDAYLSSVSARYVLFRRDGTPIRAHVTLSLEEIPVILSGQNPTSRTGLQGQVRQRTLTAGESLPLIAYQEYGHATDWRAIAEASDIDDPARLTAGTPLLLPPAVDVARARHRRRR
jgi:nucleoid-associated protein YgaU